MSSHHRTPITVRLDRFEGPLDLLLHLIQSHDMDISVISVSRITDQYLAYVRAIHELNFEIASEFLVMAATLIQWKSKAILPKDEADQTLMGEEDEDILTQDELIRRLLEHQRFLAAGDELASLPKLHEDFFVRPNLKPPIERVWRDRSLTELTLSYQDAMLFSRKRKQILRKETVSLAQKISEFGKLQLGKVTSLTELMESGAVRPEQVVTFLASLELAKLKKLKVYQDKTYDPIFVELVELIKQADIDLAKAFEEAEAAEFKALQISQDTPSTLPIAPVESTLQAKELPLEAEAQNL
jgi:segregation and condensation protein A